MENIAKDYLKHSLFLLRKEKKMHTKRNREHRIELQQTRDVSDEWKADTATARFFLDRYVFIINNVD